VEVCKIGGTIVPVIGPGSCPARAPKREPSDDGFFIQSLLFGGLGTDIMGALFDTGEDALRNLVDLERAMNGGLVPGLPLPVPPQKPYWQPRAWCVKGLLEWLRCLRVRTLNR
jgi:hypothetical protein